jgi:hypothetical protein
VTARRKRRVFLPMRPAPTFEREIEARLSKPRTKKGHLQRHALALLLEHERDGALPTNTKFVSYEAEQRGIISKEATGVRRWDQDFCDAIRDLRELGLIPRWWIVDETRTLHEWSFAATVTDYVMEAIDRASIDLWDGEPPPLLLTESRAFGGVLRPLAREHLCPIAATGGQTAGFLYTSLGPALAGRERPVFYVGDLDLSGEQIEAHTRTVLEKIVGGELDWTRLALTQEQADEDPLRLQPVQKHDRRYRDGRPHLAIEVEALGQQVVMEIVREALEELLPEPLDRVRERERREQEEWREFAATFPKWKARREEAGE